MSVQTKYYNLLKIGSKTIELRLFDDKRKKINVGDHIKFFDSSNKDDAFEAVVVNLHKSDTFENLFKVIDVKDAGGETPEAMTSIMEEFYPLSKQIKLSVVGIEVKRL